MIKFRPKLGDINEILAQTIEISSWSELEGYLAERSFIDGELSFIPLDPLALSKLRPTKARSWETHIVCFNERVVGVSDGVLEELAVFE